jgi:RNA polymerase sigma factor (sigma-70 family)
MKSVAMNLLGNTSDAEDAVQEAFLKLYRSWGAFKGESLRSTWLYRILVNTCYDIGRRRKRTPEPATPDDEQAALETIGPAVGSHAAAHHRARAGPAAGGAALGVPALRGRGLQASRDRGDPRHPRGHLQARAVHRQARAAGAAAEPAPREGRA